MSWAARHQVLIIAGIVIVLAFLAALVLIPTFYHTPSCTDGTQNQKEEGIDCGGPCTYLCTALVLDPNPPRFTRALAGSHGSIDVISYLDNPNGSEATRGASYLVELYDKDINLITTRTGTVDIPAAATIPVYIPNIFTGERNVARAELTLATTSFHWYREKDTRPVLSVRNIRLDTSAGNPRVYATIENPTTEVLTNLKVIATIFDADKNAIAASQTVIPILPAQGQAEAVFTWSAPFTGTASRIDVLPVVPLPRL